MEYGCIAQKLGHSFSAIIHSKLADYNYELKELQPEQLKLFFEKREFKAINVTIPYKKAVIEYLDYIDPIAKKIGAVNTIVNNGGHLSGYNTDFYGMTLLINRLGLSLDGKKVLILGTGGTCATAEAVAESMGAALILKVSRTKKNDTIDYSEALSLHNDAQIIINTTPCGMYPQIEGCPIDVDAFGDLEGVIDAVYNPLCSRLVEKSLQKGIKAEGGLYMLIAQAVKAAEYFIGLQPDIKSIDKIYADIIKEKTNIVLIGMPSSGKTTVGKALAKKLNKDFIDTDEEIKKNIGMEISDFFKLKGEKEFRKLESEVARQISKLQNCVISTGGGMVLNQENIDFLKLNGRVYFLDRPLNRLIATTDRPLSATASDLEKRYKERYKLYLAAAEKSIDASGRIKENADKIKEDFLNENTYY